MAELAINNLVKIIIIIFVILLVGLGLYLIFSGYIHPWLKNLF